MDKKTVILYLKNSHRVIILGVLHALSLLFLGAGGLFSNATDYMSDKLPIFGMDEDN